MVNLLPDILVLYNICGYPADSDIIKLVLLVIYFEFITISSTK